MGSQLVLQICGIDVNHIIFPHNTGCRAMVTEWNTEAAALIIDKAVKGDLPLRAQIEKQSRMHFQHMNLFRASAVMQFLWHTGGGFVVGAVLLVAPVQCSPVQICNVPEDPSCQEVLFYKTNQPLHLALGEGMPGLAELRAEAHGLHKCLIILLPHGMSLKIPVEDNAFHVVGQNVLGDAHAGEAVDHADEEVLLLGIGKELHIPLPAMVTDHGEAGSSVLAAVVVHHIGEAPVHLEGFSWLRGEPTATAALGSHQLPLGGNQKSVGGDIVLDGGQPTRIPHLLEPLQADLSVGDALDEEFVQDVRVAGEHRLSGLTALQTVGLERKVILFEPAQLRP